MATDAEKAAAKAAADAEKAAAKAAKSADGIVFVNAEKLARAKDILELVSGKRAPRTDAEAEQKERYAGHFAAHDQKPQADDALRFVYETLLGGLVRTADEQEEADEAAATAQAKMGKNALGEKTGT